MDYVNKGVDANQRVEYSAKYRLFSRGKIMNKFYLLRLFLISLLCIPFVNSQGDDTEEVVVTGSLIATDREVLSVPVDSYDRDDFESAGSPEITDLVRNLTAVSGVVNTSEQFIEGGTITGIKNVNIRGLGLGRTLVLINGKRMVETAVSTNAGESPVDIGNFPAIALKRIELLKNGGSTVYGSDAVAGVFNMITRTDFEGFEMNLSTTNINNSDPGYNFGFIYGNQNGDNRFTISYEYEEIGRLMNIDLGLVDWSSPAKWPLGFSSFGMPGTWHGNATPGQGVDSIMDPTCGMTRPVAASKTGGLSHSVPLDGSNGFSKCGYNFVPFSNTIDPTTRNKVYVTAESDINDTTELYFEYMHAGLDTTYTGSPSYPPTAAGYYVAVPSHNPGFQEIERATGEDMGDLALTWLRPRAIEGPGMERPNYHDSDRIVAGVRGDVTDNVQFDVNITYGATEWSNAWGDVLTDRYNMAMHGIAGEDCRDPATGEFYEIGTDAALAAAGQGNCHYYNPIGAAIGASPSDPYYNHPDAWDFFWAGPESEQKKSLTVGEFVFSGSGANDIGWAVGAQFRKFYGFYRAAGDNRCPDNGKCNTVFHFLTMAQTERTDAETTSLFAEVVIPAGDNFELQLGARYIDYDLDQVTKPRASFIWDATDIFSLRFSYEQTYRTPILSSQVQESLQRYAPLGEYVTISTPVATSLLPEESDNMNIGFIIRPDERSQITFDYFNLAFTNGFGTETATCPCADIIYNTPGDASSGVNRIETELINGDDVDISGLDFEGSVGFDAGRTVMQFSYGGTYLMQYDVAGAVGGGTYDALGKFNTRSSTSPINLRSLPELQLFLGLGIELDIHSINMYIRHTGEYDVPDTITAAYQFIDKIDSMNTLDFNYSVRLADDRVRLNLSAHNLLDEAPPLAPSELGYDAYSHSPVGRIIKAGIQYRF